MKTELQKKLAKIAPSVSIVTFWSHDPDLRDIREDCDGFDDEDPDDWQAWLSEVRASAIADGEEISGSAYLGGTWEKADDVPEISNPTISGYERQMTEEALRELGEQITNEMLCSQIIEALRFLETAE
jgi:hypothetical protein